MISAHIIFTSKKAMNIYANALTEEAVRRDFYYAFTDKKYPGVPELNLITIDEHPFFVGDIPVQTHTGITSQDAGFMDTGLAILPISPHANRIEEAEKEKVRGSKVLVLNALRRETTYLTFHTHRGCFIGVGTGSARSIFYPY